jgi:hypothetical protein
MKSEAEATRNTTNKDVACLDRKVVTVCQILYLVVIGTACIAIGINVQLTSIHTAHVVTSIDDAERATMAPPSSPASSVQQNSLRSRRMMAETAATRAMTVTEETTTTQTSFALNVAETEKAPHVTAHQHGMDNLVPIHPDCIANSHNVSEFCSQQLLQGCMTLQVEIPQEPSGIIPLLPVSSKYDPCQTLWFASFHEGSSACPEQSDKEGAGYAIDYSAALSSAIANAGDTLHPVLLLGRYGLANENSTELSTVGKWAAQHGATVIVLPRLSFQDDVNLTVSNFSQQRFHQASMGPFMRLDIPRVIHEYKLFDNPNICQRHVLYTDSDVLFTNKITHQDMDELKHSMESSTGTAAVVAYGREFSMTPEITNTGVMLMDVPAFEKEWPSILSFAKQQEQFPGHDQLMLNNYFKSSPENSRKRSLMSIYWNWKAYWKLEPGQHDAIKVLHFHGPKPGKGLEEMGSCSIDLFETIRPGYRRHFSHAVCCDQGKTAYWARKMLSHFEASKEEVCAGVNSAVLK